MLTKPPPTTVLLDVVKYYTQVKYQVWLRLFPLVGP